MSNIKSLPNILLIEDDEVDIMNFERALRKLGFVNNIKFARNGVEARKLLFGKDSNNLTKPLALILDLNMPKVGGHQLIEEIRHSERFLGTPIFVLTSSDVNRDKQEAWSLGVNAYFLKSMSQNEYLQTIRLIIDFINQMELPH